MDFNHKEVEKKWRDYWFEHETNHVPNDISKPKFYVLDMFPYPSGAGLHVGHPLGYIASDIIARHKRMQGYNVLHPMGFDAFGLPAEQYAIQTGVHPEVSTQNNMARYREQLNLIGLNYDWSREVITCDPQYYKWTQWIFLKLFSHYYNTTENKAKPIEELIQHFKKAGTEACYAFSDSDIAFTSQEWKNKSAKEKDETLMNYRLAYRKQGFVNWCEALGTVLANDEIKDGVSERGGHPVEKKAMMQWALRITSYADRLLSDLDQLAWSDSMKNMQRNWIGKSSGAQMFFDIEGSEKKLEIFTTRPDTIFGVSFMVIAPEHEFVKELTTPEQKILVAEYVEYTSSRSDLDRISEKKSITGCFTGSYCIHPFNGNKIPIWISEYVLIDYGTGAIMAVPGHDTRDRDFAKKFNLSITQVVQQDEESEIESKSGVIINSDFLNGLPVHEAIEKSIHEIKTKSIGFRKNQFRLRDANFSRQRYWGEPFPVYYDQEGTCHPMKEDQMPLILPHLEKITVGTEGKSPLVHAKEWANPSSGTTRELDTMPGYAGSSWYFLRYMNPDNHLELASKESLHYWQDVDLYIGGTEHAVGHLMYARFWHKFLYDLGITTTVEPFKKLVNQGMIQGIIENIILIKDSSPSTFISASLANDYPEDKIAHIPLFTGSVKNYNTADSHLDKEGIHYFINSKPDFVNSIFKSESGEYTINNMPEGFTIKTKSEVGKMSKRYHNVVNPDDVINEYGADVFRMYEMFLGPLEDSKPWDTKGITGVSGFIKKYYRMFFGENQTIIADESSPTKEELKILHTCIKKVNSDIENLSFNTSVSSFMICVNELRRLNCKSKEVLSILNRLLAPFAPFITEEINEKLGNKESVHHQAYPTHSEEYLISDEVTYPVSINGKKRHEWTVSKSKPQSELESEVLQLTEIQKWLEGVTIKKIIVVQGRMINIVLT
ncbi:MAG: leucine--tRNA ligase [Saprospiraceae bacterium]|nr:leucine--tRNA ligase [Saprospiraceae bacterium]